MKYISKGYVVEGSTEHIMRVSHFGREFRLTGVKAALWLNGHGRFDTIDETNNIYRRELEHADVVTISGSAPAGLPQDVYVLLIEEANAHGKPVLLDTSGPLLREALHARPRLVKPNAEELHQLTGADTSSLEACAEAARLLRKQGAQIVAVSLGKDGVLVSSAQGVYRGITPDVPVVNTVGCGDSMVAGFAVCLSRGLSLTEGIRYAVAVSTANALTKETGYFRREDLDWILPQVSVVPMQAQ